MEAGAEHALGINFHACRFCLAAEIVFENGMRHSGRFTLKISELSDTARPSLFAEPLRRKTLCISTCEFTRTNLKRTLRQKFFCNPVEFEALERVCPLELRHRSILFPLHLHLRFDVRTWGREK
jgi:hypothetical protein